jgi:phosphomannomutase
MTAEVTARYGAAYGAHVMLTAGGGNVLIGRDSRTSGPLLTDAASAGIRSAGLDVLDVGIAPTPSILLSVKDDPDIVGAMIVTASHNPVEWNGLKLAAPEGTFLTPEAGLKVQALLEGEIPLATWDGLGRRLEGPDVVRHHIERILGLPLVDETKIAEAGLVVALDCVHGAGGVIMPELLERLGCRVIGIGLDPDGRFPRNPEPTTANLGPLGEVVREAGADVGLAVDPDVDRLAVVDETGEPIGEDWTLALAAEYVLKRDPGPVVTNLSSSQSIEDVAERAGVPFHRTPVGEIRVATRMAEVGAVVGGEGNGGVMLSRLNLTRDAPLAAALVLGLVAESGKRPGALVAERPGYAILKRKVQRPEGDLAGVYAALEAGAPAGAEVDRSDGLRLTWREAGEWVHLRPSGTEPILRICGEASDEARVEELVNWAGETLSGNIR